LATRGEALAKQFEEKAQEAVAVVEKLSDADWNKVTEAEKWPVGVTAHHLAGAFGVIAGMVSAAVSGESLGDLSLAGLHEMNARHAKESVGCTRAETVELFRKGIGPAAAVIRGLTDDQLGTRTQFLSDVPPMTVEEIILGALIHHIDEHIGSIRKATGR